MKPSASKHNSDYDAFFDWIEADVLLADDEIAQPHVVDLLIEQQVYTSQDFCSEFVENAWNQVDARVNWPVAAPIVVQDRRMTRRAEWTDVPAYTFCVVVSLGPHYDSWTETFGHDYNQQGSLFEAITEQAMTEAFKVWKFTRTGWSTSGASKLRDVIGVLVSRLQEPEGDLDTYATGNTHEAGLDLVWHLPFRDARGGLPIFLTQCASGTNWPEKLATPSMGIWQKLIAFPSKPYKAFALPFALDEKTLRRRSAQAEGVLLDRYRLVVRDVPESVWVSAELRQKLIEWLQPRIDWLLER